MNRIQEIVALQKEAEISEKLASVKRWRESKLIWEELADKTYRQLSGEIKAAGGSGSLRHLTLMFRCYQFVVVDHGLEDTAFTELPKFNTIYHSDEVRGESDQKESDTGSSPERKRGHDREDFSADGLAETAANAIDSIVRNPAIRDNLTDSGMEMLRQAYDQLRRFWRESSR